MKYPDKFSFNSVFITIFWAYYFICLRNFYTLSEVSIYGTKQNKIRKQPKSFKQIQIIGHCFHFMYSIYIKKKKFLKAVLIGVKLYKT